VVTANMMSNLIIVGATSQAKLAHHYFRTDTEYNVIGFAVNREYISSDNFDKLQLIALEDLENDYPPDDVSLFVAVGYSDMNQKRAALFKKCKEMGYFMPSYISTKCNYLSNIPPGENCLILEDNTIQPYSEIGNNVTIWSGNHIGHDVKILDHCFITSHVVISGFSKIGEYSFLGVNSTIRDGIEIGKCNLIGAGATIMSSTQDNDVWMPPRSVKLSKSSNEIKIS